MNSKELKTIYQTIDDVLGRLSTSYGRTFKEFDVNNRLLNSKNKGALGNIVEEGIFGYNINSNPEADFYHLGLELKTTGIIRNKNNTIRAKERLALETINYGKVVGQNFETSDLWNKIKKMLLVIYEYVRGLNYGDMKIITGFIHEFSDEDLLIIKRDYELIVKKILDGKADQISEGDTLFLGACTAGTGQFQDQPFSNTKAKQRKFSLKNSYISQIIRQKLSIDKFEHIVSEKEILKDTFENILTIKLQHYFGKTEDELREIFHIDTNAKNRFEMYVARMLNIKGKVNNTDEFLKANLKLKTIRVQSNNRIKESMSFPTFSFEDIVEQDWEDNDFRNTVESSKFLFAIFKEKNGKYYFSHIKVWNIPIKIIEEEGAKVYNELKKVLLSGNIVKNITKDSNGNITCYNNFPGIKFSKYFHVRPHAADSLDTIKLPTKDVLTGKEEFTKQCFWLNSAYIEEIINE